MSEEYMIGHYFKRMSMLELALGDADFHLRRFLAEGRRGHTSGEGIAAPKELASVN
jgi:hypothetical protein